MTPTKLSLREMRGRGYLCEVVEHFNHFTRTRKDLFGFGDVICLGDSEVVLVQTTSYSNLPARIRKIAEHENIGAVRKSGIKVLGHGWKKGANGRYALREVDLS